MRSFSISLTILALAATTAVTGCAADTSTKSDDAEELAQSAEALSSESGDTDPVEDAVVTDADAYEASAEAADQAADAPDPTDIGCGFRGNLRARIKAHFDANGDGKLDASEKQDLKDFVGGHPRMKLALVKLGVRARHRVRRVRRRERNSRRSCATRARHRACPRSTRATGQDATGSGRGPRDRPR